LIKFRRRKPSGKGLLKKMGKLRFLLFSLLALLLAGGAAPIYAGGAGTTPLPGAGLPSRPQVTLPGDELIGGDPWYMPAIKPSLGLDFYGPIYFEDDAARVKPYIDYLHARGIKYIAYYAFDHIEHPEAYSRVPDLVEKGTVINLDGRKVGNYMGEGFYQHTINRPFYRDFLIEAAKRAIDAGADGVCYDVAFANRFSFDPDSMEGFRAFLAQKYSPVYLKEQYGIEDIATFDYGQYLRDRGYDAAGLFDDVMWARFPPLWDEWELYLRGVEKQFFERLHTELTNYARENYGREFYITANRYWSFEQWLAADALSFLSGETFIDDAPYPGQRLVPMFKAALSRGKRFWSWNSPRFDIDEPGTFDLTKLFIAETYASGGIGAGIWREGWSAEQREVFRDNIAPYYLFPQAHPELFNEVREAGEVAVLYSLPTFRQISSEAQAAFRGACYLLSDAHFTFDVVFAGDNDWVADDLKLEDIAGYRAVLLPDTRYLTDNQVRVLLDYAAAGGILIGMGQIGNYDEEGLPAERPDWEALFGDGVRDYGDGKVISWDRALTSSYYQYTGAADEEGKANILNEFLTRLSPWLDPEITTDLPPEVNFFRYVDRHDGSYIYHLINYRYDQTTGLVEPLSGSLSLPLPQGWSADEIGVWKMAPETPDPVAVEFTISGSKIALSLDGLGIWTVVKVGSAAEKARRLDYKPMSRAVEGGEGRYWYNRAFTVNFEAVDDHGLSRVELYYRRSPEGQSWSDWILYRSKEVDGLSAQGSFEFNPSDIGEGYYQFFTRAEDSAGQLEPGLDFAQVEQGFDVTPPPDPIITEIHGVQSDVWQSKVTAPEFTWVQPPDNLAGLAESYLYWVYWGPPGNETWYYTEGEAGFAPEPLPPGQVSIYHLYLQVPDNAGNWNEGREVFVFKYRPRLSGDIGGDGRVDAADLSAVGAAFDSTPESPGWNPDADLNRDGRIDILDLVPVGRNFGLRYDF